MSSVAVISQDGALADALTTAFFVMGEEKARVFYEEEIYSFEAVFVDKNGNETEFSNEIGLVFVFLFKSFPQSLQDLFFLSGDLHLRHAQCVGGLLLGAGMEKPQSHDLPFQGRQTGDPFF